MICQNRIRGLSGSLLNLSVVTVLLFCIANPKFVLGGTVIIDGNVISSNSGNLIVGSGKLAKEQRKISAVSEVEVRGSINIIISRDESPSLTVEADDNIIPVFKTTISGDRIVLMTEGSITTHNPINAYLSIPKIRSLIIKGSSNADLRDIKTNRLNLTVKGSADVKVKGTATKTEISISGSGTVKAGELETQELNIRIRGSGSATVIARKAIDARVSGAGKLKVKGNPAKRHTKIKAAGKIVFEQF